MSCTGRRVQTVFQVAMAKTNWWVAPAGMFWMADVDETNCQAGAARMILAVGVAVII